mmetsp:Transcript_80894/g.147562  ORF Transcript_80894/g.147562 Transcript_80894/m.147562 type:complete len:706 (-) Transcript_80894:38-2155(-)
MASSRVLAVLFLAAFASNVEAVNLGKMKSAAAASVNPIRKVTSLLQGITKKVTAEIEAKEKLYDEYMCYCKTSDGTLAGSITASENKIPKVASNIESDTAKKAQTEAALKDAQVGRVEAKEQIAKAEKLRASQAEKFSSESSDLETNIAALGEAIPAIESGMSGAFLQTSGAATLRRLTESNIDISPSERDLLSSFLMVGQHEGYVPKSGEIVGILKTIKDEMSAELADITEAEKGSVADFEGLIAAKKKEIASLTKAIETKSVLIGELGVAIVQQEADLENTKESLAEDQAFLANLEENCATKTSEWEEFKKMSNEELVALADTIKMLSDDDALELFKKALPSPSLLQVQVQAKDVLQEAHKLLAVHRHRRDYRLDLISLTLHGKQADFSKVLKMIDDMIALLKDEQTSDETKVADCKRSLEEASDEATSLSHTASDLQKAIDEMMERKASLVDEIATFVSDIESLDKSVVEATSQRKTEHEAYVAEINDNKAAVEIITLAKNRLQKFYNPGLYKEPPTTTSQPGVKFSDLVLVQDSEHKKMAQRKQNSSAVIALIDAILKDMAKEMQEAEFAEKANQEDYETFMEDSKAKRAADSKALEAHESAKADLDARLVKHTDELKSTKVGEMNNAQYTAEVHHDCDWLMQNLAIRKEARADEIDSLEKAKAVLSGADYSFLQTGRSTHKYLRASARQVSRASQIVMKA